MLPTIDVKVGELLVDAIVRLGFAVSKREARYFITHGAVRLRRWRKAPPCDGATVSSAPGRPGDEFGRRQD